jgi:cell cycle sensor histidine kinase DivJ
MSHHDHPFSNGEVPLLSLGLGGVAGAVAAGTAGGLTGPLGAACLLPLALATWGEGGVAAGAALSVATVAIVALAQLAGALPGEPTGPAAVAMGALCIGGVAGLAGGGWARRTRATRDAAAESARDRVALETLLREQPGLLLGIEPDGGVRAAYGTAPAGVDPQRVFAAGLPAAARPEDRPAVLAALRAAVASGAADVAFAANGGGALRLRLRLAGDGRLVGTLSGAAAERDRVTAAETAARRAAEASAAKSRFLADMSHELRTPLNAIMGFSDIMRARLFGELPGKYGEYADLIHESGQHLLDLINDVLDVSKIEAAKYELQREAGDAREPVQAALRLLRVGADEAGDRAAGRASGRRAGRRAGQARGQADGAEPRLERVEVHRARRVGDRDAGAAGEALELTVADTGVGVAPEDLERLGRPYEQAEAGRAAVGTGLGLSLVRALAELHGGSMTLESVLGEGTAVTVRLPLGTREAAPAPGSNVVPFNAQRS